MSLPVVNRDGILEGVVGLRMFAELSGTAKSMTPVLFLRYLIIVTR